MNTSFGDNLKRYRKEKKLGVNELGRLVNVSGAYISSLEKGTKNNPSLELIQKLSNALEITSSELMQSSVLEFETDDIIDLFKILRYSTEILKLDDIKLSKNELDILFNSMSITINAIRFDRLNNTNKNGDL